MRLTAVCLTLLIAMPAFAENFHDVTLTSVSTSANDLWPGSNLVQGPGVGYDAAEPHDKLIGGADGNWVTADDGGFPADYIEEVGKPVIVLDLGADVALDEVQQLGDMPVPTQMEPVR